ncbi:MAG: hypothetical protein JNJ83_10465 [Verrucomicrobiaceae bacterium]|nr:hypothetical protein [Verrucomicrobiaceae bacterium]
MPFDPNLPAANSSASSAQMREQLNSLKALIDDAVAGSSANTNAVTTLTMNADVNYDQNQMQLVIQKLDEVILMLRR